MFVIFWLHESEPACKEFNSDQMMEALAFAESLRKKRREEGAPIHHVTMSSENPDSVGQAGVDATGPEYNWTKRRYNERPK